MTEKQAFVAAWRQIDPNLANMLEGLLETATLSAVKLRLRVAAARISHESGRQDHLENVALDLLSHVETEGLGDDTEVHMDSILAIAQGMA